MTALKPLLGAAAGLVLLMPAADTKPPWLIWNASASVAVGLYHVERTHPRRGDIAVIRLPSPMAELADARGYLPLGVYLVKPVVAVAGDRVCRVGIRIWVRGIPVATAAMTDARRRPMPDWQGCLALEQGQLFILGKSPSSFDSRYFGPLPGKSTRGHAKLVAGPFR